MCHPVYIGAEVGDEGKPWSHTIIGLILSTQCAQLLLPSYKAGGLGFGSYGLLICSFSFFVLHHLASVKSISPVFFSLGLIAHVSKFPPYSLLHLIHPNCISYGSISFFLKKRQAQFLLAAIQVIAEAARFKYIEKLVEDQYEGYSFVMNDKMYSIVKKWDTISTAIANAKSSGQFIKNENGKEVPLTLVLVGPDGQNYDATNVKDVESDMGILKYVDKKCAVTLSLHPMTIEWPLTLTRVLAHV